MYIHILVIYTYSVAHVNVSYRPVTSHICMSHFIFSFTSPPPFYLCAFMRICFPLTYEWVMSHIWIMYIWMSHVTHMNESYESCYSYEWFMLHIRMRHVSHVTHMNGSYYTYKWVILHEQSFDVRMHVSCLTYRWVTRHTHIWMGHVTHTNESYYTYTVLSCIFMCRVSHIDESRDTPRNSRYTYKWFILHELSFVVHIHVSYLTYLWVTRHTQKPQFRG